MLEFFFRLGYLGLFIVSFLGASLVPLSTEAFVLGMPTVGYNVWLVTLIAIIGNFIGNIFNYYVGMKGSEFILSRFVKIKPETWARAERMYERWGPIALFFSWVPIIGDPLTAVAGALHMHMGTFTFWVLLGKLVRYALLLGIGNQFLNLF
jgi:membrane protein YqaA with SNARE-associated domain